MIWRHNNSDSVPDGIGCAPSTARAGERPADRGVALVITLLLLFLLSVIGLAAVLSSSSDLLINGYYSNYRGSFYAADSGLNIARQAIANSLNIGAVPWNANWNSAPCGSVPLTYFNANSTQFPLSAGSISTALAGLTQYENSGSPTYISGPQAAVAGAAANSWVEGFYVSTAGASAPRITLLSGPLVGCPSGPPTTFTYTYNYSLTSVGSATGSETSTIAETGSITINISLTPTTWSPNFAYFGAFITNYPPCLGPLVPGTMTGPMFTNGAWGFMTGGTYIFTDPVGQADPDASYWVNGGCYQSATSSFTTGGQTIAPQFQGGFSVSQTPIPQPSNSYSQMWAAVDGQGAHEATPSPTPADLNADLKTVSGTPYPSTGATSGVYLNYQNVNGKNTIAGGGLYVEGSAKVNLSTSGASAQVITITQGTVTTTMTVDPLANGGIGSTVVTSGGNTLILSGVPTNTAVTPPQVGTMVYVDGTITSMSGPGEGIGAIQDGSAVTIAASSDINITGDVIYKTEPVTMAQNQIPGTPVDTLIPGNDHNQDFGIFTANGNIILSSSYSDDNLQVDGSQAVIGSNCASSSCGFLVNGCINTFNNVGGQIQTNIFGACLSTQNTFYDRRYSTRTGFAPPWFPATTITMNGTPTTGTPIITPQRTSWVASSGQ